VVDPHTSGKDDRCHTDFTDRVFSSGTQQGQPRTSGKNQDFDFNLGKGYS